MVIGILLFSEEPLAGFRRDSEVITSELCENFFQCMWLRIILVYKLESLVVTNT